MPSLALFLEWLCAHTDSVEQSRHCSINIYIYDGLICYVLSFSRCKIFARHLLHPYFTKIAIRYGCACIKMYKNTQMPECGSWNWCPNAQNNRCLKENLLFLLFLLRQYHALLLMTSLPVPFLARPGAIEHAATLGTHFGWHHLGVEVRGQRQKPMNPHHLVLSPSDNSADMHFWETPKVQCAIYACNSSVFYHVPRGPALNAEQAAHDFSTSIQRCLYMAIIWYKIETIQPMQMVELLWMQKTIVNNYKK